jgi:glycosyltransferase involved in cell wall biosynthesis
VSDLAVKTLWDQRVVGDAPDLSIIVPCRNEARYLGQCLQSIRDFAIPGVRFEIIFVDNGSTDASVEIAKNAGVDVGLVHSGRIGSGRNAGAEVARGDLLMFLDADVCLTPQWKSRAAEEWRRWRESEEAAIWGSWYSVRPDGTWVEKAWFDPFRLGPKTHMNGGHLIMRALNFQEVGGFSPHLETGEDYEFSRRAVLSGLSVHNDEALEVIHLGYPQTVRGFFSRELWHGRGDVSSIPALLNSKTAMASVLAVHLSLLGVLVGIVSGRPLLATIALLLMLVASVGLVLRNFGKLSRERFVQKVALGAVYVTARGLAVYSVLSWHFSHKGIVGSR